MATKAKKKPAKKTAVTALAKPGSTKIKAKKTPAKAITKKTNAKQLVVGPWAKREGFITFWVRRRAGIVCAEIHGDIDTKRIHFGVELPGNEGCDGTAGSVSKAMRCIDAVLVALGYKLTGGIPKGVK